MCHSCASIWVPIHCMPALFLVAAKTHTHTSYLHFICFVYIYLLSHSLAATGAGADATRRKICSANFSELQCDAMAMKTKLNEMKRNEAKRYETQHHSTIQTMAL